MGGTYFVNRFVLGLSAGRINSYAITYGIGRAQQQPTSGNFVYLLLMNPAATFYAIISEMCIRDSLFAKANDSGPMWALVTSATLLVMFPLFVMFCVFQKQFVSSFVTSGIK